MTSTLRFAVVLVVLGGCGSGSSGSDGGGVVIDGGSGSNVSTDMASYAEASPISETGGTDECGTGTLSCGDGWCCDVGTSCIENKDDKYGCGTAYCCLGCLAGFACGAGCCGSGTACVDNDGHVDGCSTGTCCEDLSESDACSGEVAARCSPGTTCRKNHSARLCPGSDFACYLPAGQIGCPGEVLCPNGIDFCPAGSACGFTDGVCPMGSSSGNYCCQAADPCGAAGSWSVQCPERSGCGACATISVVAYGVDISDAVAANGGTWSSGERTFTFTPETCTLHVAFSSPCGDLPGDYVISDDGTASGVDSNFGCWDIDTSECLCTETRPDGECTAAKL